MFSKLAVAAAAAVAVAAIPAAAAAAGTAGAHPAPQTRVMHLTSHGARVIITFRGGWRLAAHRIPGLAQAPAVRHPDAAAESTNWGGYVDTGHNVAFRFSQAEYTAPNLNCTDSPPGSSGSATVFIATGLGGWTTDNLQQDGYAAECVPSATPVFQYTGWYSFGGTLEQVSGVVPGDSVQSNVYFDASTNTYTYTVNDLTQNGAGFTAAVACTKGTSCGDTTSAEVTSEIGGAGPSSGINLPDYGSIWFNAASTTSRNGTKGTLGASKLWSPTIITTVNGAHLLQSASALQSGSTAYQETWKAAS